MQTIQTKLKWAVLLLGDIAIFYLALWLTLGIRYGERLTADIWSNHFTAFSLLYASWLVVFYIFGLYDARLAKNNTTFYTALLKSAGASIVVGVFFFYFIPFFQIAPKTNFFLNLVFVFILLTVWRRIYNKIVRYPMFRSKTVIVGRSEQSEQLATLAARNPQLGYEVVAIIDPDPDELAALCESGDIGTIVTAIDVKNHPEIKRVLYNYLPYFEFADLPGFYEQFAQKVPLSAIDETWFIRNLKEKNRRPYEFAKRGVDVVSATVIAGIFSVLLPFVALAIKLDSPGPVFYRQKRAGKNTEPFDTVKFRSMTADAEQQGAQWAQKNDKRITRVGKFLRATYLDELPQCINILKGEMSIVGPRPERPEFIQKLQKEIPFYHVRHVVKPGLTGWAQIKYKYGNSDRDALEKLQYELYYLKNRSVLMDTKIILKTLNKITRKGHL